jgi:hypothetical protein
MNDIWITAAAEFLGSFTGVLGALLVFWLGNRHSSRQEEAQKKQDLMTTLKLLFEELGTHHPALRVYAEKHELARLQPPPLTTDIWHETRFTIARSEYIDLWGDLIIYFSLLRRISQMKGLPIPNPLEDPVLIKRLAEARQQNQALSMRIENILLADAQQRERSPSRKRFWKRSKEGGGSPSTSGSSDT